MKDFFSKADQNNSILYETERFFWQKNQLICGVDEVGRGCLAGPIVTAAVILYPNAYHAKLKDSKLLSSIQIENIYQWVTKNSFCAIGISNNRTIDQKNIYKTTQLTMKKAILHLLKMTDQLPARILIDAMPLDLKNTPYQNIPLQSLIKGELKSASIAAASIIAKATRDEIIKKIDQAFPLYGFLHHKGYATATHIQALKAHQASIIHRKTFIKNFQKDTIHDLSEQQNLFC